jgi:hypothetical protein
MSFDLMSVPITFASPRYLSDASAWIGHIPFAFTLTALARPKQLVELGTHKGDSYMAFCQAVQQLRLETQCAAVDTWTGDPHAGFYSGDVLTMLRAAHDPAYGSFSRLLQMTFDAAAATFADGSVDLLHIDGLHTYEAVKHDYKTWLPKLSPRAVVIFHDTAVLDRGFGVHQFFAEVSAGAPSFNFLHSFGLGVLALGPDVPKPVLDFLHHANRHSDQTREVYASLAAFVERAKAINTMLSITVRNQAIVNNARTVRNLPIDPWAQDFHLLQTNPLEYMLRQSKAIEEMLTRRR